LLNHCFVLHRRQTTQPGLPPTSVIRPLDPGHDRAPQLIPGGPPATVEDILLQQSEERLHSRVIASRADAAHRPDNAVAFQCAGELLRPELAAAIRVRHAPGHVTSPAGHSHLKSVYG